MRREFFEAVIEHIKISPVDFPEPVNRKKRQIETLMPVPPDPRKGLAVMSNDDLKKQEIRDRYHLQLLKLRIQPIMDQIKIKYKKFMRGVIDDSQIRYLFDEDDPSIVSTDLPHEQRRLEQHRPYEKGKDKHGRPGLRETDSGRFFYNLEIVTIEKRLSNGYYNRPWDYLSDIKTLTKDAFTARDQDRLLRANELQANVEVDMITIQIEYENLGIDTEGMYQRATKKLKDMEEKAKELGATEGQGLEMVPSNVPPGNTGPSPEQSSGPITLGQPVSNGIMHHPTTPSNPSQPSQHSNLTNGLSQCAGRLSDLSDLNGHSNQSNGTSVPSREESDTHVTSEGASTQRETQNSSFGPSAQTQPPISYTVPRSLSQRSVMTAMAEGSNPQDYTNNASTTSSDKAFLTSSGLFNTQSSHGKIEEIGQTLSTLPEPVVADSQIPDTQAIFADAQGTSSSPEYRDSRNLTTPSVSQSTSNPNSSQSQKSSQPSQNPAVPPFPRQSNPHAIRSLLNDAPPNPSTSSKLVTNPKLAEKFLDDIAAQSNGCSVEQLEQIYSALMDKIWKTRGEWNRVRVTAKLKEVFDDVLRDIRENQETATLSLEIEG